MTHKSNRIELVYIMIKNATHRHDGTSVESLGYTYQGRTITNIIKEGNTYHVQLNGAEYVTLAANDEVE